MSVSWFGGMLFWMGSSISVENIELASQIPLACLELANNANPITRSSCRWEVRLSGGSEWFIFLITNLSKCVIDFLWKVWFLTPKSEMWL